MDAEMAEPDPARKSEPVTITTGILEGESQDWGMRTVAAHDHTAVMRAPRGLDAYGVPRAGEPDVHDCKVRTIGFGPGEYLVGLALKGKFDSQGMVGKKFVVEAPDIFIASAGKKYPDDYGMPGSRHGRI
ncbi:MAG: hypothetical protein OXU25_05215 [Thaumarchaeota archaeon]|nr:hypothetical protein [Nitrososphaerota archaeon]